jgi:apolipoprotein N-acyltransferase
LNSIYVVPELAAQFAIWTAPGIIGIAIAGAMIFSPPFIITNLCMRRWNASAAIRPFIFAGLWTLVLWLREWLLTGFPWNPVANVALPFPALANSMSLWGALGLTFVIIGLIASVAELIKCKAQSAKRNYSPPAIFLFLLVMGIGYGYKNIKQSRVPSPESPVIRIVQPAFSQEQKASHSREQAIANAEENIRSLAALARAPGNPGMIIFPETAYPFVIARDKDELPFAKELGAPVVVGATSWRDGNFYNSMIIADAGGKIEKVYSKSHLVPFGESHIKKLKGNKNEHANEPYYRIPARRMVSNHLRWRSNLVGVAAGRRHRRNQKVRRAHHLT